jgi:hypothetical protein
MAHSRAAVVRACVLLRAWGFPPGTMLFSTNKIFPLAFALLGTILAAEGRVPSVGAEGENVYVDANDLVLRSDDGADEISLSGLQSQNDMLTKQMASEHNLFSRDQFRFG